ncbi:MAG: hypothetical protein IPG53_10390 [Ignavibacteriales bacterium]|nr:hypothetical protein [Ignavibacteriales bacterium]
MGNYYTHKEITELHHESLGSFDKTWSRGKRNERYKQGIHWTDDELRAIKAANRHPYSISLMNHKLNNIISTQRQTRTSLKVSSSEENDIESNIATEILKRKERTENLQQIESELFDAGLSVCFGAAEILPSIKNGEIKVMIKRRDYLDVFWDSSARDYNLDDALFIAVGENFRREDVERKYGRISSSYDPVFGHSFYREESGGGLRGGGDVVRLINHYTKREVPEYLLLFNDYRNHFNLRAGVFAGKFETRAEIEKRVRILHIPYLENNLDVPVHEIIPVTSERITKYILTGGEIIDIIDLPLSSIPINVYRPFHFENKFWSLADLLAEPQIFLDRVFMQIDYSFGRDVKNVYQGNVHALAESETPETALRKAEKTGGIIWTRTGEEVFRPLKVSGVNPQYFQIASIMQGFIEDLAGGRSFHGLADYSNESGKAILAKQKQGLLAAGLVLDNLKRWKCSLGEKLLEAVLIYEGDDAVAAATRQIMGEVVLGDNLPSAESILMMDHEIVVTEAPLSSDEKSEKLEQLVSLNNIYPGSVPIEVVLNYMNLETGDKDKIIKNYNNTNTITGGNNGTE